MRLPGMLLARSEILPRYVNLELFSTEKDKNAGKYFKRDSSQPILPITQTNTIGLNTTEGSTRL